MSLEHLPQLDAIASAASGRPTKVYLDDSFLPHLKGLADWSPTGQTFVITLNPALLSWQHSELESVFYHEVGHVRCGHVNTTAAAAARASSYDKMIRMPVKAESYYTTVGQVRREEEAEAEATRLRGQWPFVAYRLWKLIQGKETYP